jgi:hypothetical protein
VIFISGKLDMNGEEALKLEAIGFVRKPFSPDEL